MTDFEATDTTSSRRRICRTGDVGWARLVPPYIREMCKCPKSAELRVSYDAPTAQSTYTFSLSWDEDVGAKKTKQKKETLPAAASRDVSYHGPLPVIASCDGPCQRIFPSSLLNSIGRCDHYLCNACFGLVTNSDGSNGCSAFSCNWKGATRSEAKRNYEHEVCEKQRERAREMKLHGADVKLASLMSNRSEEEQPSFQLIYPSNHEMIGVKLVVLEHDRKSGMLHTFVELEAESDTKLTRAISWMLSRKRRDVTECFRSGTLYFAELQADWSRKLRRIRKRDYKHLSLFSFPQIAEHIVFVLDLGDFVSNGAKVYYE